MIANASGNLKKPVNPDHLYHPSLTREKRKRVRTPEEERVWKERTIRKYEHLMSPTEEVDPGA